MPFARQRQTGTREKQEKEEPGKVESYVSIIIIFHQEFKQLRGGGEEKNISKNSEELKKNPGIRKEANISREKFFLRNPNILDRAIILIERIQRLPEYIVFQIFANIPLLPRSRKGIDRENIKSSSTSRNEPRIPSTIIFHEPRHSIIVLR